MLGKAEVRKTFNIPKRRHRSRVVWSLEGSIHRNSKVRVVRDGDRGLRVRTVGFAQALREGREARSRAGFECGISVERFNDIKIGDILESYKLVETEASL